jgi:hypothetical protein
MIEQFCKSILQLNLRKIKSLANLAIALASQTNARSVVEVSLNPNYHYQYSSISKSITSIFDEEARVVAEAAAAKAEAAKAIKIAKAAIAEAAATKAAKTAKSVLAKGGVTKAVKAEKARAAEVAAAAAAVAQAEAVEAAVAEAQAVVAAYEVSREKVAWLLLDLKKGYIPVSREDFLLMNTDISSLFRSHSPTLPNNRYVHKPNNQVKNNKPVGIGYEFCCVGLVARNGQYGVREAAWNLPLSMKLVPADANKNAFTAEQVNGLMNNPELPFHNKLTVNALDSAYGKPEYIASTYSQPNLVSVIRMASNINMYKQLSEEEKLERRESNNKTNGADAVYGEKYKLSNQENWTLDCDAATEFGIKIGKKTYIVQVQIWEDMMLRSKRGLSMKDKSCRLARIELLDQDGNRIFKKVMWLSVWGLKNKQLSLEQIFWAYHHRFDMEHFFRFGKQNLLLDKLQTPIEGNMENWLEVVSLAYWMLWVAQTDSKHECHKWQKYDKNHKTRVQYGLKASPSEVQKEMGAIISRFEQTPFMPKPRNKGKGRKEGMKLSKRKKHPVIIKSKKAKKQMNV